MAETYGTDAFIDEWSNDVKFHVARNVLYLRRFRKLSQAAVASAMGTSQSAIARVESGQENITVDTLRKLAEALGGRFFVSIPPAEHAPPAIELWWEKAVTGKAWSFSGYRTWQDANFERGSQRQNGDTSFDVSVNAVPPACVVSITSRVR